MMFRVTNQFCNFKMQLNPVTYSKGGASGGEHTFYSNLKACLNAKISIKLRQKNAHKNIFLKNQKLLAQRFAICPLTSGTSLAM